MLDVEESRFIEKISTCIQRAMDDHLGEYGASLIEHLIIVEISESFRIEICKRATMNEVINEARKEFLTEKSRSLADPQKE